MVPDRDLDASICKCTRHSAKKEKKIVARSIMPMFLADRIANYSAYFHALIQIPEARCGGC